MRRRQRAIQTPRQVVQLEHHEHPPRHAPEHVENREQQPLLLHDRVPDRLHLLLRLRRQVNHAPPAILAERALRALQRRPPGDRRFEHRVLVLELTQVREEIA